MAVIDAVHVHAHAAWSFPVPTATRAADPLTTMYGDSDVSTNDLKAIPRTEFGKGAARRLRAADMIPAVIYGHGEAPRHVTLPGHDTMLAVKNSNALLTIHIENDKVLGLVKDVQRDPVKRHIEHVDLVIVRRGEKVQVEVSVYLEGEAAPETVVTVAAQSLQLEVEATAIPESLVVDVEGLEAGTQVLASSVTLPAGAVLLSDPDTLVVNVTEPISQAALEAELGEGTELETDETAAGAPEAADAGGAGEASGEE